MKGTASLLPASKSISNRALIINALAGDGASLHNLSDANDTQLMLRLVGSSDRTIDVEDAGTTMRFLTAYFAVTDAASRRIIGSYDRRGRRGYYHALSHGLLRRNRKEETSYRNRSHD